MSDFYDDADLPAKPQDWTGPDLGPVFTATYTTESTCCGEMIRPGDEARADGSGGWIHAVPECEKPGVSVAMVVTICSSCFCVHAGECS